MPPTTGPRHPLFLRLLRPISPLSPEPFVELTMDDEDDPEASEVGIYLATRPSRQLEKWASDIKRRHRLDKTFETDKGVSSLSLDPLRRGDLRAVGRWNSELIGELGIPVRTVRGEQTACVSYSFIALAVLRATEEAVGFVSFTVDWRMDSHGDECADVEIEPDQAWIDPMYRRQQRGELMAFAIGQVVAHQFKDLDATTRWRPGSTVDVNVLILADIRSKSGEAFLKKCAEALDMEFTWWIDLQRMKLASLDCRPYW